MTPVPKLWGVYVVRGPGNEMYIGAVRAASQDEALAAARERWCADDPLPWQYPVGTTLRAAIRP